MEFPTDVSREIKLRVLRDLEDSAETWVERKIWGRLLASYIIDISLYGLGFGRDDGERVSRLRETLSCLERDETKQDPYEFASQRIITPSPKDNLIPLRPMFFEENINKIEYLFGQDSNKFKKCLSYFVQNKSITPRAERKINLGELLSSLRPTLFEALPGMDQYDAIQREFEGQESMFREALQKSIARATADPTEEPLALIEKEMLPYATLFQDRYMPSRDRSNLSQFLPLF
jgi:hypothetical protein